MKKLIFPCINLQLLKVFVCFVLLFPSFSINSQTLTDSNLPIIIIDTDFGQNIPDEPKIWADMKIIYNGEGVRNNVTDAANEYNGRIGIELRGSSSQNDSPKKSYSVETRLSNGDNNNVNIFGFGKENDWVLYAPYFDKTMMRNVICYQLARDMGLDATKTKYAEVVINNEYLGIYIFMEKIKRDDDRVDIKELTPSENTEPGITGGYIFKKDRQDNKLADFYTLTNFSGSNGTLRMRHPKDDVSTQAQEDWLAAYIGEFETRLYGDDTTYKDYIKENSFVDHYLLTQASKNIDGFRLSQYFYKDSAERIVAGPVWDYNLTFGKAGYLYGYDYDGWYDGQGDWVGDEDLYWWNKFLDYPHFNDKFAKRWKGLRTGPYKTDRIFAMIDSLDNLLTESRARNFQKWPILDDPDLLDPWHHHEDVTWTGVITYLKDYIRDRFIWIDEQLNTVIATTDLVINEIHYNPDDSLDKKEFIELYNNEITPVDLSGYTFSAGITYTFPNGTSIAPDEYIIIAKDASEFSFLSNQVFQWTAGALDNDGEAVAIDDNTGACVDYVLYNDKAKWPGKPDGKGPSLELIHPSLDNVITDNWVRSRPDEGTPGRTNDDLIDSLTIGTQTACDPSTNTYTQEITVHYLNEPSTGTLNVNSQSFSITGTPQTVTLTGLNSDSLKVDVAVFFSDAPTMTFFKDNAFNAPDTCFATATCSIDNVVTGTQSACDPGTNKYSQDITVTFSNGPGTGTLDINGQNFTLGTSPQTITLTNLESNGSDVDVNILFSDDFTCPSSNPALFTAPAECIPCSIDNVFTSSTAVCNPGTNTYDQDITIAFTQPPSTGTLDINGDSYPIGSSPQTISFTDLAADGNGVNVTATFSDDIGCTATYTPLYTAPVSCDPCLLPGASIPYAEGFENTFPPVTWTIINNDGDDTWEQTTTNGRNSTSSLLINNYTYNAPGEIDDIEIEALNFSGYDVVTLSFDRAYTVYGVANLDTLRILASGDCGQTWDLLYSKDGTELETVATQNNAGTWRPDLDSDWAAETVDLSAYGGNNHVLIRFRNINNYGNRIWIDNINIDGTLSIAQQQNQQLKIYPNPTSGRFNIEFTNLNTTPLTLEIISMEGKKVYQQTINNPLSNSINQIDLSVFAKGTYFVRILQDELLNLEKIILK